MAPTPIPILRSSIAQLQDGAPSRQHNVDNSSDPQFQLKANANNNKVLHRESSMNIVRQSLGLYAEYPLANALLSGAPRREKALKTAGTKQINHVRGTDGWLNSMLVFEVRSVDKYIYPWSLICMNAVLATLLSEVGGFDMSRSFLIHWDAVYSLVLKTSLAFLLVFRLNRVAIRYWESRTMWGNVTHLTRNLVGGILTYCRHAPRHRDGAIRWASSFCVAAMHFIRNDHEIATAELAGFLSRDEIDRMQDANHGPLYAASMVRYHLRKALATDADTPPHLAHSYAIQMSTLEELIQGLVTQVSGMERVRSTPLPIVYVTHLRTFLFAYLTFLPYVWVKDWRWGTVPLVGFTAFALLGIEGASSECEIPFNRSRPNHLALDAYCLVTLDSIMGLVVHDANMQLQEQLDDDDDDIEKQSTKVERC